MNPRLFCRERSYQKALLLTYSFDPIFFEQMVLPDLWNGRSADILVVGDCNQISEATSADQRHLWHLGRSYLLAPARHRGAFHPKMILRLGAKDGVVMVGSGNVTSGGWGGNQELGVGWLLGPGHADTGAWLHDFLADVANWCSGDLEREAISRMRDVPWLSVTAATPGTASLLHSRRDVSLASLLSRRWTGRRFDSVSILTGSTDESGAFLRWAHAAFGIRRAVVALTPASASFDPAQLGELPVELVLVSAPPERPMHAKFYWFEGEDSAAAVMGSANCSAAAWLLQPAMGGNIETIVVYDSAVADDYLDVLEIFKGAAITAEEQRRTPATPKTEAQENGFGFRLSGLRWDRESGEMTAFIDPCPTPDHHVQLIVGEWAAAMSPAAHPNGGWVCLFHDEPGSGTTFACVQISCDGESWTVSRWIDDLLQLRHASQSARLLEPFKSLERGATSSEQRQMLEDLKEVAHALFNDASAFRDPGGRDVREKQTESESDAAPVDPNDLVCHLDEGTGFVPNLSDIRPIGLSISGILRALFDTEENRPSDGDDPQVEGGTGASGDEEPGEISDPESRDNGAHEVEGRFRERLAAQISGFLEHLGSATFADHCSATQMVQAIAFPLAVGLCGRKRGWVSAELAEDWARDVISIVFQGTEPNSSGLLDAVRQRYVTSEQRQIFDDVVGDGTLWMILVSTLAGSRWQGPGAHLDKAIALRDVFISPALSASANRERIAGLIGRIRIENARKLLAHVAPRVRDLLAEIETWLRPVWMHEVRAQAERRITHRIGDLLWRDNAGWATCLEDNVAEQNLPICVRLEGRETRVKQGFYVNVSELSARDGNLDRAIGELRSCVELDISDT